MKLLKSAPVSEDLENLDIIREIKQTQKEIDRAYERFQNLTDNDLLEACIYELQALKSRHSFYLKRAKEQGISCGEEIFSGKKVNNA